MIVRFAKKNTAVTAITVTGACTPVLPLGR